MADVGNANINITADSGQAEREVKGFMGSLRRVGDIATGVMGGLAIFEGIKNTFSGVWDNTIGMNASLEQYENTLTVVQGSQEKAAETLAWVRDFAASTPFEIPGLVESATKLESYGLTATEWLPAVGDMAAVMGKDVDQATEALADGLMGEMERLKEFGIKKDDIVKMGEELRLGAFVNAKGQITDQEKFNEALKALMEERFSGGMEMQAQSFKGLISNAKDSMGTLMSTLSQPLFEDLKEGMQSVVPIMSSFTSFVTGDVKEAKKGLVDAFGEDTANRIFGTFETIKGVFDDFKQLILDLQPTWENLKEIGRGLEPLFNIVGGAIAVVWQAIQEYLPPILEWLTDLGVKLVEWEEFIPLVIGLVTAFATFKTIIGIMNLWKATLTAIRTAQMLLNASMLANPIVWIVALIVGLIAVLVYLYNTNEDVRAVIDRVWQGIKDGVAATIEFFTKTIPETWAKIDKWFSDGIDSLVEGWNNFKSDTKKAWKDIKADTIGKVKDLAVGVAEWVLGIPDKFQEMKDNIIDKIQSINLFQQGKDVVQGFIDGIGNMIDNVARKAREIGSAISSTLSGWFEFGSPSKLMMSYGSDTGEGYIIGLDQMIREAARKAKELGRTVTENITEPDIQFNENQNMISGLKNRLLDIGGQFGQLEGLRNYLGSGGEGDQHTHYWNVNAEEISDVQQLIDVIDGVIQQVRSR